MGFKEHATPSSAACLAPVGLTTTFLVNFAISSRAAWSVTAYSAACTAVGGAGAYLAGTYPAYPMLSLTVVCAGHL